MNFIDSRISLDRAKEHVIDLQVGIEDFYERREYAYVTEPHEDGFAHKIKLTTEFPLQLNAVASDAAVNLRSSLDQLGYACAIAAEVVDPKNAYFPFSDSAEHLEHLCRSRCKDIPDEILTVFRSFKPHKGGDDVLWSLNALANTNKHRLLVPVGVFAGKGQLIANFPAGGKVKIPVWDRTKNEVIFAITADEEKIEHRMEMHLSITFHNIGAIKQARAVRVLGVLVDKVKKIIDSTEAEAIRIGLIT